MTLDRAVVPVVRVIGRGKDKMGHIVVLGVAGIGPVKLGETEALDLFLQIDAIDRIAPGRPAVHVVHDLIDSPVRGSGSIKR